MRGCSTALGIRFVGERTAELNGRKSVRRIDAIAAPAWKSCRRPRKWAPKVAESVFQFFREPRKHRTLDRLRAAACASTTIHAPTQGRPAGGADLRSHRHRLPA